MNEKKYYDKKNNRLIYLIQKGTRNLNAFKRMLSMIFANISPHMILLIFKKEGNNKK